MNSKKEYQRNWEQANRDKRRAINKRWRQKMRTWFKEYKKTLVCERCGFDNPAALTFHHLRDKKIEVSLMVTTGYSKANIRKEMAKCIVDFVFW